MTAREFIEYLLKNKYLPARNATGKTIPIQGLKYPNGEQVERFVWTQAINDHTVLDAIEKHVGHGELSLWARPAMRLRLEELSPDVMGPLTVANWGVDIIWLRGDTIDPRPPEYWAIKKRTNEFYRDNDMTQEREIPPEYNAPAKYVDVHLNRAQVQTLWPPQ